MFVLVRHAHAGGKGSWPGSDDDRPLSPLGTLQSKGLVALLEDIALSAVLTSPSTRCRQTVEPLAAQRRLPVQVDDALTVHAPIADLLALMASKKAEGAVLCTHGEVVARILAHWRTAGQHIALPHDLKRGQGIAKGAALLVHPHPDGSLGLRYLPPNPATAPTAATHH